MKLSNMNKKYTIDWMERKTTSTGKAKADATLKDEAGATFENVTIWADFPGFAELMPGSSVEGEIVEKQNGQYVNKSLYAPKTPKTASGSNFKAVQIEKAMDKKNESIAKFQISKEEAIKMAGAQRDAVLIVTTFYKDTPMTSEQIKAKVLEFRDYFLSEGFEQHLPF